MKSEKLKVVTVDDFGMSRQANSIIFKACEKKVITHASLMVNTPGSIEALNAIKRYPKIQFGLHVNLSEHIGWPKFLLGLNFDRKQSIESEINRQILIFKRFVDPIPFLNSHHNIHFFPTIFPIVYNLMKRHKISKIRYPKSMAYFGLKPFAINLVRPKKIADENFRLTKDWVDLDWAHQSQWLKIIQNLPNNLELSCHPKTSLKWLIQNAEKLN